MKRILVTLLAAGALVLSACTSDSALPTPTGKGAIRAINAIKGSTQISFLIEETLLNGVQYKASSSPAEYDDFSYNFNFEIVYPGDDLSTRVATETVQLAADTDHVLLLTGDINAPTVTSFSTPLRTFTDTETVFETRFVHANATLGDVDVYFEDPSIAPGTNPPAATLSFGEMTDPADFEEGNYIMTVTAAGDVNTVYFTSRETALLSRFAHVMTIYEGDLNDTGPVIVRSMTSSGSVLGLADANYPAQLQFVHAASTLEPVDVYDDEALTSLVYSGLSFTDVSPSFDALEEATTYYFTPVASTATVLFEAELLAAPPGSNAQHYLVGDTDAWSAVRSIQDRSLLTTTSKIKIFHASFNHQGVDVYLQDRDVPLGEDDTPELLNATFENIAPTLRLAERDVDIYVTPAGEKTVLAGPFPFDAVPGTNLELMLVDQVGDPAVIDIIELTLP